MTAWVLKRRWRTLVCRVIGHDWTYGYPRHSLELTHQICHRCGSTIETREPVR